MPCTLKCHCFQKTVYDFQLVENKLMGKMNISSQQLSCFIRFQKNIIFFALSTKNTYNVVNKIKTNNPSLRELKI